MKKNLIQKIPPYLWVASSGWISKIIASIAQLISIPIFYAKLGLTDFAVMTIITSLVTWYSLVDLGISTALQNFISEYRANNKNPAILLTMTFPLLIFLIFFWGIIIAFLGSSLKAWLFSHLPNNLSLFNFKCVFFLYCSYFIVFTGNKVLFAYQKGMLTYLYQTICYIILIAIVLIIHFFSIPITLSQALYCWIIPLFVSGIIIFLHAFNIADVNFKIFAWHPEFFKMLMARSLRFWFVSLSANGVLAIDYLIIVKMLSAKDVLTYSITNKIFMMALFIYTAVLSGLWPILAEHYARKTAGDYQRAEVEIRRTMIGGLLYMVIMTFGLIVFRNVILQIFKLHQAIELPVGLILLFGLYGVLRVICDTYTTALQSRNRMKIFIYLTPVQAMIAVPSMIGLARFGLYGVMLALIFSMVCVPLWAVPYFHYKMRLV